MWKASWGLSHVETQDNPTPWKIKFNDLKEAFLAKEWNPFYLSRKKLDYLHLKKILKYECGLYLTPPQHKSLPLIAPNHRLAIELHYGWLFLALEIIHYATFAPYNVVETKAHFV